MTDRLLTLKQVGEKLGLKPGTLSGWLRTGKLPGVKISGKYWRVKESDLEKFMNEQQYENSQKGE